VSPVRCLAFDAERASPSSDLLDLAVLELLCRDMEPALANAPPAAMARALTRPFVCELTSGYHLRIWGGMLLMGLGLIWLVISRSVPRVLDAEGVTLRSGERHLWRNATDLARVRVVGMLTGAKLDYYLRFSFGRNDVVLTPGDLANGAEAVAYLEALFGARLRDGSPA
jgi:hypothetical protein